MFFLALKLSRLTAMERGLGFSCWEEYSLSSGPQLWLLFCLLLYGSLPSNWLSCACHSEIRIHIYVCIFVYTCTCASACSSQPIHIVHFTVPHASISITCINIKTLLMYIILYIVFIYMYYVHVISLSPVCSVAIMRLVANCALRGTYCSPTMEK